MHNALPSELSLPFLPSTNSLAPASYSLHIYLPLIFAREQVIKSQSNNDVDIFGVRHNVAELCTKPSCLGNLRDYWRVYAAVILSALHAGICIHGQSTLRYAADKINPYSWKIRVVSGKVSCTSYTWFSNVWCRLMATGSYMYCRFYEVASFRELRGQPSLYFRFEFPCMVECLISLPR
ncbi:hypothetical protein ALC56_12343 [Trachymyrmex septentrionalis]|uniref:Uncharacterized protein n=1 Tax=Trachymyrmex septentrionalis TaxID=34720 RepID=A0A195EZT9_9HYME|nr:hypothetical protein ALC56_12343 [Trachymyrmex septentrionalis]